MNHVMTFLRWSTKVLAMCIGLFACEFASGGLTGENVAVVVNGSSVDSLTIANHYVSLRNVPPQNVIVLGNVPEGLTTTLDRFRDDILRPVLETINSRGLAPQIHVIAYSAGFPTSVDISAHTSRLTDPAQQQYQTPTASINSLTYFYRWVLGDSPDYLGWGSNFYARGRFARHFANPFAGAKREQFQKATDAATQMKYRQAAEEFEALSNEYPTLHPLCLLAAENWARSGDNDKALEQVREAIRHGWINRRYLTETEPLSNLFDRENPEVPDAQIRLLDALQDVPMTFQGPVAFSSSVGWTLCGHPVGIDQGAMPHMLSCSLAVIHENASTLEQSVDTLRRAASADRTYPEATFGFSKTSDVRSTTRMPGVPDAIAWLLSRDRSVEIFSSPLPNQKKAYVGMMLGAADLPVKDRSWTFAAGAIADNLTSLGAVFSTTSQTKLTELLHAGAAISSGAVAEPYAIMPKFPSPMMYPYYNEGVTAIEAFYLSIASPYQMLIVGDPLCQPYARAPNDFVRIVSDTANSGAVKTDEKATPNATAISVQWQRLPESPMSTPTVSIEIYLQGKLVGTTRPVANLNINLQSDGPEKPAPDEGAASDDAPAGLAGNVEGNVASNLAGNVEGEVDLRVVLVGRHPTQPKIGFREQIVVGDESRLPRIERLRKDNTNELTFFVECSDADRIEIVHAARVVSTIAGSSERITLPPETVGRGPVRLQAIAYRGDRPSAGRSIVLEW